MLMSIKFNEAVSLVHKAWPIIYICSASAVYKLRYIAPVVLFSTIVFHFLKSLLALHFSVACTLLLALMPVDGI